MPQPDRPTRISEMDAKGGSKEGVVRWVLAISLGLAIVAMTLVWVTGALTQGPVESQQNAERKVEAQREQRGANDSSIDGIVADDPDAGAPKTSGDQ